MILTGDLVTEGGILRISKGLKMNNLMLVG
jgi:hypothetical protein